MLTWRLHEDFSIQSDGSKKNLPLCTAATPLTTAIEPAHVAANNCHIVSFDWFLSGLCRVNYLLGVVLLKLLIFYQKLLKNIRSRLNSSTFWVFEPVFRYFWSKLEAFCTKNEDLDQIYLTRGSKTQNVEKVSLALLFPNNFW